MRRAASLLAVVLLFGGSASAWTQDKKPPPTKLPDGVYAVLRDSLKEKEVLPLKKGEVLIAHKHLYLKKDDREPPRFLVVRSVADVDLALAEAPKADKEGKDVVRILLKLQPKAAKALERLTTDRRGRNIAIILGGEVVTMHKIREVIKGGQAQITSCTPGGANILLEKLQALHKKK